MKAAPKCFCQGVEHSAGLCSRGRYPAGRRWPGAPLVVKGLGFRGESSSQDLLLVLVVTVASISVAVRLARLRGDVL